LGDGIELLKTQQSLGQTQEHLERLGESLSEARQVVESRDSLLEDYNLQRDALLAEIDRERLVCKGQREQMDASRNAVVRITAEHRMVQRQLQLIGSSRLWRTRNNLLRLLGKPQNVIEPAPVVAQADVWPPSSLPKIDIIIPV